MSYLIDELQKRTFETCKKHGFEDHSNLDQKLLLAIGELTEAQEELRAGHDPTEIYFNGKKPEGFPIELADALIRIMNILEYLHLDAGKLIAMKDVYNQTRPYKHGKQF